MSRQDQYDVTVVVSYKGEERDLGTWDKMTGGEKDSEETKYRPGAMGDPLTLGGYSTVGNITVSKLYTLDDVHGYIGWLLDSVGKGDVTVTKQPLDTDGNKNGSPLVYSGKVKQVNPPEADSESSDAALVEMEVSSAKLHASAAVTP